MMKHSVKCRSRCNCTLLGDIQNCPYGGHECNCGGSNPTTTDREGFDAKKFLVDFYAYIHTSNPEGKTALVDYDTWAARLEIALKEEHQRTLKEAIALSDKLEESMNTKFDEWRTFKGFRNALRTAISDITSKEGEK